MRRIFCMYVMNWPGSRFKAEN